MEREYHQPMRAKLIQVGDELAIEFEPTILQELAINTKTEPDVTTDGTRLIITPASAGSE